MGLAGGGGGSQSEIKPDGISGEEGKTLIPQKPIEQMPENVAESLSKYQDAGWKNHSDQTSGTKAGKTFQNDPPILPKTDSEGNELFYREFDVNNKIPGQPKDGERFVVDNLGRIFYTNDHYNSFIEIILGGI